MYISRQSNRYMDYHGFRTPLLWTCDIAKGSGKSKKIIQSLDQLCLFTGWQVGLILVSLMKLEQRDGICLFFITWEISVQFTVKNILTCMSKTENNCCYRYPDNPLMQ